ncbi:sigma-70 family RNA polymerase sigma factor [Paenibacillus albiflavus]|uniref:Sigma-70 family RNA polymerase sigma factor n=2 Tax=Paenibacillus albiflavus TaxID=2545760 RepID=A0A4R4EIE7_9BACL|nr:sigma-70 family RNA polymerase sigma factor [Paenibacillus albiflavus]
MYRVAKSFLKTDMECADAIQETILKAFQAIRSIKEPDYFKTWLIRILINVCQRMLKMNKQVIPMAELTERSYENKMQQGLELWEAVQSLEEELRIIVTLFYIEDVPLKDIALMLDVPEGTIKSRLYRAREKLVCFLSVKDERSVKYE